MEFFFERGEADEDIVICEYIHVLVALWLLWGYWFLGVANGAHNLLYV